MDRMTEQQKRTAV